MMSAATLFAVSAVHLIPPTNFDPLSSTRKKLEGGTENVVNAWQTPELHAVD
jgi:hypothetical protein